jgi:tetratricopeptide (TPR) repeat protein
MKHFSHVGPPPRNITAAAIALFAVLGVRHAESQSLDKPLALTSECVDWIQNAVAHVETGQLAEAEAELAAALVQVGNDPAYSCTGLILHNMATIASISGRFAEGERLAIRSIATLEKVYPPDDPALLRPLLLLASTRLEQGNRSGFRNAFKRLKGIRPQQLHESAMIHAMEGSLLQSFGKRHEAEVEYLAALGAWTGTGRSETAEAGAVVTSLAMLYIEERRFEEAQQSVERASAIFSEARDAAPMDRTKLLGVRGVLHAQRHEWPAAEKDFRDALSLADSQPAVDTAYFLVLLARFAEALDKNHHRREARRIEARAAAFRRATPPTTVVDLSELLAQPKRLKK